MGQVGIGFEVLRMGVAVGLLVSVGPHAVLGERVGYLSGHGFAEGVEHCRRCLQ